MAGGWRSYGKSRRWPTGHFSWVFKGEEQFEGGATSFLAEGAARGERLMIVSDDPSPDLWPERLVEQRALMISSTTEVYGASRVVDAAVQRETFASALAEALSEGYSGIRVAADNTSLTSDPERLEAWMRWEEVADRFMAENPVTGMCGFDRQRATSGTLHRLSSLHEVSVNA